MRGGLYGDQPSLTKLGTADDDGDLVVTTNFRDVYATVLGDVLATDPAPSSAPAIGRWDLSAPDS